MYILFIISFLIKNSNTLHILQCNHVNISYNLPILYLTMKVVNTIQIIPPVESIITSLNSPLLQV